MTRVFHNPVRVHFGRGAAERIGPETAGACIVVTTAGTARRGVVERLRRGLEGRIAAVYDGATANPTVAGVTQAAARLRGSEAGFVLAVGGGSAIDAAKAVAAQWNAPDAWLERHLRGGEPFPRPFRPLPIVAAPTTAGTGSEVTPWATIWDEASGAKYSLSHPALYPAQAFVDPELTLTQPPELTATTALDALSHAMESIWNRNANPVSSAVAEQAIAAIPEALAECLERPAAIEARERLQHASVLAGMAISGARTALAHSMSYPLTGELGVPHGLACSLALPEVLEFNAAAAENATRPIARALGARSAAEARWRLAEFLDAIGVGAMLRPYLEGRAAIRLKAALIHPGRAGNNLREADNQAAAALLNTALARYGIAARIAAE